MFNFGGKTTSQPILMSSELHDENTFYHAFINDLNACREEVIIESPFISSSRMKKLYPVFEMLIKRGVRVYVMTRDPREHDESMDEQSEYEIQRLFWQVEKNHILCLLPQEVLQTPVQLFLYAILSYISPPFEKRSTILVSRLQSEVKNNFSKDETLRCWYSNLLTF